ncbi:MULTISPECIES: hypothetical protein [Streptococcus]|uniref:hypothetical protein n=1 Tax=Streptococcus TaxID=1301 RepID=UPI00321BC036
MKKESNKVQDQIPISENGLKMTIGNFARLSIPIMALGDLARIEAGLAATQLSTVKAVRHVILNSPTLKYIEAVKNGEIEDITKVYAEIHAKQIDFFKTVQEAANNIVANFEKSYLDMLSKLSETIKLHQPYYSEEEFEKINENILFFASEGWVIYFQNKDLLYDLIPDNLESLEKEWYEQLEDYLENVEKVSDIENSNWYSQPLIKSLLASYQSENYYSAYTLATIAIDGAINRFNERTTAQTFESNKRGNIKVGSSAVKDLDQKFQDALISKSLYDTGLMNWLENFFKFTPCFKSNSVNRHMISHGRWESEISKKEFLKLFNVLLYINEYFDFWYMELSELIV